MMNSNSRGLFKNIASLGLVQIANYVIPLISIPIISRILGPEKFGVINYAFAFVAYFNILIGFGFDLTATRRISKDPNNLDLRIAVFSEVFWSQLFLFGISLGAFVCCLLIVPPLAEEKTVAVYTYFLCIGTLFAQNWIFQAMQDLPKIAWLNLICKVVFTGIILLSVRDKQDYVLQPLITGIMHVVISLLSFTWAYRRYQLKFKVVPLQSVLLLIWNEKIVFFSLIAVSLYTTTNTVMLGLLETPQKVGFYSAAQRLISVVTGVINMPLSQAFYPFIGYAFSQSIHNGLKTVQRTIPLVIIFTLSTSIFIFLFGPFAIRWFYGVEFIPAIEAFRIIAFIPVVSSLSNMFGMQVMLNLKLDNYYFRISAGGAVIGLILNYFMIKKIGYVGTAWNWVIVECYITAAMYLVLRSKGINPIDFHEFKPSALRDQVTSKLKGLKRK